MSLNFYIVCFDFQVDVQWWKETNGHPRNGSTSTSSRFEKTKIRGGNVLKSWTTYYWHVQNFIQSFIFNFFYLFVGLHDSTSLCGYSYEQMYCCISLLKWEMILRKLKAVFYDIMSDIWTFSFNYLRFFVTLHVLSEFLWLQWFNTTTHCFNTGKTHSGTVLGLSQYRHGLSAGTGWYCPNLRFRNISESLSMRIPRSNHSLFNHLSFSHVSCSCNVMAYSLAKSALARLMADNALFGA